MNRLKELIEERGITQKKLAQDLKCNRSRVSQICREVIDINYVFAKDLMEYFDCSLGYLLGYEDDGVHEIDVDGINMRLKAERVRKGYTQSEVADAIGIAQNRYSLYELGRNNIPYDLAVDFAKFLNIELSAVFSEGTSSIDEELRNEIDSLTSTEKQLILAECIKLKRGRDK